jgi:sporulation protein YlmC with PRC-barrel domain
VYAKLTVADVAVWNLVAQKAVKVEDVAFDMEEEDVAVLKVAIKELNRLVAAKRMAAVYAVKYLDVEKVVKDLVCVALMEVESFAFILDVRRVPSDVVFALLMEELVFVW